MKREQNVCQWSTVCSDLELLHELIVGVVVWAGHFLSTPPTAAAALFGPIGESRRCALCCHLAAGGRVAREAGNEPDTALVCST